MTRCHSCRTRVRPGRGASADRLGHPVCEHCASCRHGVSLHTRCTDCEVPR